MNNIIENIKAIYNRGGVFLKLLYVNSVIFFVFTFFNAILGLFESSFIDFWAWFSFDSNLLNNLYKPWSIITYMFIHGDFMHLLSNMIVLFFIGGMFENMIGSKRVLSTYIIGGVLGALLYIVAHNIFPLLIKSGDSTVVGASAAVMAIFVGIAAYAPHMEISFWRLINIKLYVLAIIYVGLDLIRIDTPDGIAHFAHLGGAAWGYYMGSQLKNGKDVSSWFDNWMDKLVNLFKRKPKMKVSYTSNEKSKPPRDDYDYNAQKQSDQQKLNAILDKIKVGGYETLSKKEKEFLNNF